MSPTRALVLVPHTMSHRIPTRVCIRHPIWIHVRHSRAVHSRFLATKTLMHAQLCDNGFTNGGNQHIDQLVLPVQVYEGREVFL